MLIRQATSPEEISAARMLFEEYAAELGVELGFQKFEAELASLPGRYAPPRGRLLLAWHNEQLAGCNALRPLTAETCEMKRMFVRPEFRRHGAGRLLAEAIIAEAKSIGYAKMQLDTLSRLRSALRLYQSLGFSPCPAYYETPLPDTIFMELIL